MIWNSKNPWDFWITQTRLLWIWILAVTVFWNCQTHFIASSNEWKGHIPQWIWGSPFAIGASHTKPLITTAIKSIHCTKPERHRTFWLASWSLSKLTAFKPFSSAAASMLPTPEKISATLTSLSLSLHHPPEACPRGPTDEFRYSPGQTTFVLEISFGIGLNHSHTSARDSDQYYY